MMRKRPAASLPLGRCCLETEVPAALLSCGAEIPNPEVPTGLSSGFLLSTREEVCNHVDE